MITILLNGLIRLVLSVITTTLLKDIGKAVYKKINDLLLKQTENNKYILYICPYCIKNKKLPIRHAKPVICEVCNLEMEKVSIGAILEYK